MNRIREFKKIAERLESKISLLEGVSGIVFMGGLVRGFADKYSDIGIVVLLRKKDEDLRKRIRKIGKNEQKRFGVEVDLEVHSLKDLRTRKWDETAMWDFSRSEIVFDPEGDVRKLFERGLKVSKRFWLERIVTYGEYLKWYCCPPQDNIGTIAETWVARGDLISAHYCLEYGLSLMIRIVFALNREFLPPPQWEIFCSYTLKWLPPNYEKLLGEALTVKSLTKHDLYRRLSTMKELWREILTKIRDKTGLTPALISRQYAKYVLRQG
jgi:predicted nucleotidyltransferase